MVILFCHDLLASEHSGGESRVLDTLEHSTLCLFRILIDEGFLRYFANIKACFSVDGSFVSVGHVSCTWHGQKLTALISGTERHGAAALMSTYNTAKNMSSDNHSCVHACNWTRVGGLKCGCSSVESHMARTCDCAIPIPCTHSTSSLDSECIR